MSTNDYNENKKPHRLFSYNKIEVLGMEVDQMRVDRAVHETLEFMKDKDRHTIFFLSAASALYCQDSSEAADYVSSCSLVLPGDSHVEQAMEQIMDQAPDQDKSGQELPAGLGKYADAYLKKLFHRLNRDSRSIYVVFEQQEDLDAFLDYAGEEYPGIRAGGITFEENTEGEAEKVVNDINAVIPDLVFVCLRSRSQIHFVRNYFSMMNLRLCVCMEGLRPLVIEKKDEIPPFIRALGLTRLYRWFRRNRNLETRRAESAFRKKMTQNDPGHSAEPPSEDSDHL